MPQVYECQVTGVYEDDRLIDAKSMDGRPFRRLSYVLPWISATGSGIDLIPQTGDKCLVLVSDSLALCLGFRVPTMSGGGGQELGGRLEGLKQGSICLRVVSGDGNEALLLLSRDGTALIGANDVCRTLYSPCDSSIIHIFNNWQLTGPGGYVKWTHELGSEDVKYEARYQLSTKNEGIAVDVVIGGDDPLAVVVGEADADPYLSLRVSAEGEVFIEGNVINISGKAAVHIDAPTLTLGRRKVLGQGDAI